MDDIVQEKILERMDTPALDPAKRIIVKPKKVYGNFLYYPVCDNARVFASIAGDKTLNYNTMRGMSALGYWFQFEPDDELADFPFRTWKK